MSQHSTKPCRECGVAIIPTERQQRKRDFFCRACRKRYDQARHKRFVILPGQICARCPRPATRKVGLTGLCEVCDRKARMRARAKEDGKTVPSKELLDGLINQAIAGGMICSCCQTKMGWLRSESGSAVITLQHDHSGLFRLICLACNKRHASYPNDSFYTLAPGNKKCHRCQQTKVFARFYKSLTGFGGVLNICKDCIRIKNAERRKS